MILPGRVTKLLETGRVANVPSVLSNVAVGVGLAHANGLSRWPWEAFAGAVLLYIAGNFLNDWMDLDWDQENRPERALPSGLFPVWSYLTIGVLGCLCGISLIAVYGQEAIFVSSLLVLCIFIYTWIHKKTVLGILPMGLCRACLPVLGYLGAGGDLQSRWIWIPAAALFVYIASLTINARYEGKADFPVARLANARALLVIGGLINVWLAIGIDIRIGWVGLVPFIAWMAWVHVNFSGRIGSFVGGLLAGIPLLDWVLLLPIGILWMRGGHLEGLWAICLAPLCFIAGRALQRVAVAT